MKPVQRHNRPFDSETWTRASQSKTCKTLIKHNKKIEILLFPQMAAAINNDIGHKLKLSQLANKRNINKWPHLTWILSPYWTWENIHWGEGREVGDHHHHPTMPVLYPYVLVYANYALGSEKVSTTLISHLIVYNLIPSFNLYITIDFPNCCIAVNG